MTECIAITYRFRQDRRLWKPGRRIHGRDSKFHEGIFQCPGERAECYCIWGSVCKMWWVINRLPTRAPCIPTRAPCISTRAPCIPLSAPCILRIPLHSHHVPFVCPTSRACPHIPFIPLTPPTSHRNPMLPCVAMQLECAAPTHGFISHGD